MGLFSDKMQAVWDVFGEPEIWECNTVDELGKLGHLDECEFQVLIDKGRGRYYLTAMSADPDRDKGKIETLESGLVVVEEDTSPKPCTILYYVEISSEGYRRWRKEDRERNLTTLRRRAARKAGGRIRGG